MNEIDGDYVILEQGDDLLVEFRDYDRHRRYTEVRTVATGYYVPVTRRAGRP